MMNAKDKENAAIFIFISPVFLTVLAIYIIHSLVIRKNIEDTIKDLKLRLTEKSEDVLLNISILLGSFAGWICIFYCLLETIYQLIS